MASLIPCYVNELARDLTKLFWFVREKSGWFGFRCTLQGSLLCFSVCPREGSENPRLCNNNTGTGLIHANEQTLNVLCFPSLKFPLLGEPYGNHAKSRAAPMLFLMTLAGNLHSPSRVPDTHRANRQLSGLLAAMI